MKVLRGVIVLVVLLGAGIRAYERFINVSTPQVVCYAGASRGDVLMTVSATGTFISTLELSGQVDESDIGKLHPGQDVGFTVDAYPGRTFHGTMTHVRLYATSTNNVVTYQAIVSVNNPDLKLLPSMTANMKVEVARASNVVRVPNTALRFRPTREMFEAFDEAPLPTAMPTSAPAPRMASLLWTMREGKLQSVPVTVGLSDGQQSELVEGAVEPGDRFVTSVTLPRKATPTAASPFAPSRGAQPPGRGGPGPGR